MSNTDVNIAVVGAGIAGLTVAAALSRAGVHCEVFEQARMINDVGAGIQLAPNAAGLLHRLGLDPYHQAAAVRPEAIEMRRWEDARVLRRTPLGAECEDTFGAPYYTLHRADLHQGLLKLLNQGTLHLGLRLERVEERSHDVALHFADGCTVTANLVIGADGIHSVVRELLVTDTPKFSGQSIYRGTVPTAEVPHLFDEPKVMLWLGPGQHCVTYPISGGKQVSFAATTPASEWRGESWSARGRTKDLVRAYAEWNDRVQLLTRAADNVGLWALHDRDTADRWSSDRVGIVGDAAHPMLPFMAQGANQAVEDGVALSTCLRDTTPERYPDALQRYEAIRKHRTTKLHRISRENTVNLHLPDGEQQRRRDAELAATSDLNSQRWLYGYDAELAAMASPVNSTDHPDSRRSAHGHYRT